MDETPKTTGVAPIHIHAPEDDLAAPVLERTGFLPIETNGFDRVFIAVVCWVALSLFWLRFVEPLGLSVWISTVISVLLGAHIIRKG